MPSALRRIHLRTFEGFLREFGRAGWRTVLSCDTGLAWSPLAQR